MPNVEHSTLTTTDLHEPKGIAAASNNEVYVADGSGSGTWLPRTHTLYSHKDNISNAGSIYVPIPYAGTIAKVISVLTASIATADAVVTVRNSAGVSMGTLTIAHSGSAAGDVDTLLPVSNNTVTADTFITLESNGASTNNVPVNFAIVLERS
jgi:hypothetical protein